MNPPTVFTGTGGSLFISESYEQITLVGVFADVLITGNNLRIVVAAQCGNVRIAGSNGMVVFDSSSSALEVRVSGSLSDAPGFYFQGVSVGDVHIAAAVANDVAVQPSGVGGAIHITGAVAGDLYLQSGIVYGDVVVSGSIGDLYLSGEQLGDVVVTGVVGDLYLSTTRCGNVLFTPAGGLAYIDINIAESGGEVRVMGVQSSGNDVYVVCDGALEAIYLEGEFGGVYITAQTTGVPAESFDVCAEPEPEQPQWCCAPDAPVPSSVVYPWPLEDDGGGGGGGIAM